MKKAMKYLLIGLVGLFCEHTKERERGKRADLGPEELVPNKGRDLGSFGAWIHEAATVASQPWCRARGGWVLRCESADDAVRAPQY